MSTLSDMSPYWMVHGSGPTSFKHPTRRAAMTEADRLARQNPGKVFVVLQATDAVRKIDVERVKLRSDQDEPDRAWDLGDDIPF